MILCTQTATNSQDINQGYKLLLDNDYCLWFEVLKVVALWQLKQKKCKKGMEGERSRPDGTVMKVQLAVVVLEILVVILMISSFNRARDRIGE